MPWRLLPGIPQPGLSRSCREKKAQPMPPRICQWIKRIQTRGHVSDPIQPCKTGANRFYEFLCFSCGTPLAAIVTCVSLRETAASARGAHETICWSCFTDRLRTLPRIDTRTPEHQQLPHTGLTRSPQDIHPHRQIVVQKLHRLPGIRHNPQPAPPHESRHQAPPLQTTGRLNGHQSGQGWPDPQYIPGIQEYTADDAPAHCLQARCVPSVTADRSVPWCSLTATLSPKLFLEQYLALRSIHCLIFFFPVSVDTRWDASSGNTA